MTHGMGGEIVGIISAVLENFDQAIQWQHRTHFRYQVGITYAMHLMFGVGIPRGFGDTTVQLQLNLQSKHYYPGLFFTIKYQR